MAVVKNLMVRAGADFSGITKETKKAQQSLTTFQNNISKTMSRVKAALAVAGIGALIKNSVKSAMEVESSVQQISRIMGDNAKAFTNWANTQALAFNMSKSEALKYGAVYGNLINGFSKGTGETLKYTQDLLKASAIIASGTGRTMEDVMERIRSGLLGNTEAIEDLGIYAQIGMIKTTDAFKKFANGKTWDQLSYQTQQQIRLYSILEQATTRFGDSVNKNTMSAQQQFLAQLKNIQLSLGQAFLPIYQTILPALTNLASKLAYVMSIVAQFSQALFGKKQQDQASAAQNQATAVGAVGDAYQAAGKQAKGALAGFDEINQLSDPSAGAADAAGAAGAGSGPIPLDFETNAPDISGKVQDMADKVKTVMKNLSDFMTEHKDIIVGAITGIGVAFAVFQIASNWTAIINGIKLAFTGLAVAIGGISLPVLAIAAVIGALVAAFVYFYRTNEGFRGVVDGILNAIKNAAVFLWQNVLVPLGSFLATTFAAAWNVVAIAAQWFWTNVLVPLGDFLSWMWKNVLQPIVSIIGDALSIAFKTVSQVAQSFYQNVLIPLGKAFKEMLGPAVEAASAVFNNLWKNVLSPFATFLGNTLKANFTTITTVIQFLWNSVLKPLVTFLSGAFAKTFDTVFKGIGEVIGGIKTTFIGLMNFITGVFTGDWKKAWEGVKSIFKGIFDGLYAIVKIPVNLIIDSINTLIRGLNKLKIDIPKNPITGAFSLGFNIPELTRLAEGGITNGPMAAMIGDNPGGREVVSPLDDLKNIIASAVSTAVLNAIQFTQGQGASGDRDLVLNIDGTRFARMVLPALRKESIRTNVTLQGV